MIPKLFINEEQTRRKILEGAAAGYNAVKSTYSPKSGNIGIELKWGKPVASHDGVTVIRSLHLADNQANQGLQLLKEASEQTNRIAGDGTSATVILAYHEIEKALKLVAAGFNPMELNRGMQRAVNDIVAGIDKRKRSVDAKYLRHIAAISAGDDATGHLIADTITKVGDTAGITVEEAQTTDIVAEVIDGYHFNRGTDTPYMWNDIDMRRAAHDDAWVLVIDRKLRDASDVRPILEALGEQPVTKRRLLIVGDVSGQALQVFVQNNLQGATQIVTVAPPVMGNQKQEFMTDLATVTGGIVITDQFDWESFDTDKHFGWADRVIVTESTTTILGGDGEKAAIESRIERLRKQLEDLKDATQIERMESRIAKLAGKIGIIRVGGATDTARKERMLRVDDAVCAARSAREDGIVPGGATTLLHIGAIAKKLPKSTDEEVGYRMVFEALQEPFKVLLNNTGITDIGYHKYAVLAAELGHGYNVRRLTDEPIDLYKEGVVDPAKVMKEVVKNATANAGIAITMNGMIVFDKEEIRLNEKVED